MIEKALIEITVNTDEKRVALEVLNAPDFIEETFREYTKSHPAAALAHGIIMKINQEIKATFEEMEEEYDA